MKSRAKRRSSPHDPIAVVDIGSNSGRVMVFRPEAGGHLHVLAGSRAALRLARDLDRTGRIPPEALERAFEALRDFRAIALGSGVRRFEAAGTSALRDAANGPPFIRRVKRELGITIRILSGLEEARFGFLGAVGGLPVDRRGVLRPGGRQPAGGPLPRPASRGRGERAARLAARLGRLPEVGPADSARGEEAPRARAGHAARGGAASRSRPTSSSSAPAASLRNLAKIDQRASRYPIARLHGYVLDRAPAARHQRRARLREAEEARARAGPERRPPGLGGRRRPRDRDAHGRAGRLGCRGVGPGRARGPGAQHGARHARAGGEREAPLARRARGALRGLVEGARGAAPGARRRALRGARALARIRAAGRAAAGRAHPRHRAHGRLLRPPRARRGPGARDRPRAASRTGRSRCSPPRCARRETRTSATDARSRRS